jgi:N-methylhydantoinase A
MQVGVDVGGTFTDCVVLDDSGNVTVSKTPSTRPQSLGVMNSLAKQGLDLPGVEEFVHGTTAATNAMVERNGGPAALILTAGTGDLLELQRGSRASLYDLDYAKEAAIIDRAHVVEATGRLDSTGAEVEPLRVEEVLENIAPLIEDGCKSIGICLLFSYVNPAHERQLREAIERRFGSEVTLSLSSDIAPEWKEYERANTTALNAYLRPTVGGYLADLSERLEQGGLRREFFVMQSSGGLMTSAAAQQSPCRLLFSGPSAGAQAGAMTAAAAGFDEALTLDMGGTSTDIALVGQGRAGVRYTTELGYGLPVQGSAVDVESIGSGGGSIARVDPHGRLLVGPESAGSEPGPACYGRGGEEPTFVDAALLLHWLDPEQPLAGGEFHLDPGLSEAAVGKVAKALGVDVEAAAIGIARVGISRIVEACHSASIGRGRDPRRLALVAFGGAGPLVAPFVARELGMPAVIVPPHPGAHSATGLLLSEFRYDFSRTSPVRAAELSREFVEVVFGDCDSEARELLRAEGLQDRNAFFVRSVEARYEGQTHTVELELPDHPDRGALLERFHALHEALYSYSIPDREVEFITWRLSVRVARTRLRKADTGSANGSPNALRKLDVTLDGKSVSANVYDRRAIASGQAVTGPALIEQMDSSTLVLPGDVARVDDDGNLVIQSAEGAASR